jgi:cyclopropane fatty-acyl-phospholipid synthase-like methyltransferase
MTVRASQRISAFVAALPLRAGMRILEIGCGPGVAARLIVAEIDSVQVLGIDRSPRAIAQARAASAEELAHDRLEFRAVAAEDFLLGRGEPRFDLAFAMRVGALDGRHPDATARVLARITAALTPAGRLFVDGGDPAREVKLER